VSTSHQNNKINIRISVLLCVGSQMFAAALLWHLTALNVSSVLTDSQLCLKTCPVTSSVPLSRRETWDAAPQIAVPHRHRCWNVHHCSKLVDWHMYYSDLDVSWHRVWHCCRCHRETFKILPPVNVITSPDPRYHVALCASGTQINVYLDARLSRKMPAVGLNVVKL